jgi:hypothetical protein
VDLLIAVGAVDRDLLELEGKGPVVRLVDLLIFGALRRAASDIHVQPLADRVLVRYRVDGVLHSVRDWPPSLLSPVVSRMKVMARLDLGERRVPQDGRATVTVGTQEGGESPRRIDLRISTLPTTYGERVVVRLLDTARSPHLLRFRAPGMPQDIERCFKQQASRSHGIVLVTGLTGSGKTTTLYSTLAWISATRSSATARLSSRSASCGSAIPPATARAAPSASPPATRVARAGSSCWSSRKDSATWSAAAPTPPPVPRVTLLAIVDGARAILHDPPSDTLTERSLNDSLAGLHLIVFTCLMLNNPLKSRP